MGKFSTDLVVTPRARGMWELVLPLVFLDSDGNRYEIPAGFTCDLASIPVLAKEYMGTASAGDVVYGPAAALHDWLLSQDIPSKTAHSLFREALYSCGAGKLLANIMYHAVNRPKESEMEYEDVTESAGQDSLLGG